MVPQAWQKAWAGRGGNEFQKQGHLGPGQNYTCTRISPDARYEPTGKNIAYTTETPPQARAKVIKIAQLWLITTPKNQREFTKMAYIEGENRGSLATRDGLNVRVTFRSARAS